MPSQSRRTARSTQSATAASSGRSGQRDWSNGDRQDRLSAQPTTELRDNPLPWAPQNRSVQYQSAPGSDLFRDGASAGDVVQGRNGSRYLGDCWLLASLAALAQTQPTVLEQAITAHDDGSYTVRLYGEDAAGVLSAEDVRVAGTIPMTANGQDAYAQREDPGELWVVVIEKAFAAWKGGYGGLHAGLPSHALTALTGRAASDTATAHKTDASLGETFRNNADAQRAMVAASRPNLNLDAGGIIPGHAHTILGVEGTGDRAMVTLRDPYAEYEPQGHGARDGVFTLTMAEFREQFDYFSTAGDAEAENRDLLW